MNIVRVGRAAADASLAKTPLNGSVAIHLIFGVNAAAWSGVSRREDTATLQTHHAARRRWGTARCHHDITRTEHLATTNKLQCGVR